MSSESETEDRKPAAVNEELTDVKKQSKKRSQVQNKKKSIKKKKRGTA